MVPDKFANLQRLRLTDEVFSLKALGLKFFAHGTGLCDPL
jgi:hypothetical protein